MVQNPTRLSLIAQSILVALAVVAATLAAPTASAKAPKRIEVMITSSELPSDLSRDFGAVTEGQPIVLDIRVQNEGRTVLTIGAVRPLCACMSEQSDRKIEPGQTGTISLTLETGGYSGPTTEAALIQWPDSAVGVTRIEMKLDVKPVLEVTPRRLVRFRTTQGTELTEHVTINTPGGAPFTVSSVECGCTHIATDLQPIEGGGYRLSLTLSADAPAGMLRETVRLHTDLETLPILEIKVTGVVKKAAS